MNKVFKITLIVLAVLVQMAYSQAEQAVVVPWGYKAVEKVMTYGPYRGGIQQFSVGLVGAFAWADFIEAMTKIDDDGYIKPLTTNEIDHPEARVPFFFDWTALSRGPRPERSRSDNSQTRNVTPMSAEDADHYKRCKQLGLTK